MKLVGEQSELVASQEQGAGTWAGKGWGSPGSPGWQPGTPWLGVAGGGWGCLSLHWLQGEPRHRAKPRCAFYLWMKVGKAYGDDVLPRGPADGAGDSWSKAAKSTRFFFFFSGESWKRSIAAPRGMAPSWQMSPSLRPRWSGQPSQPLARPAPAHISPMSCSMRTSPSPTFASLGVFSMGAGSLVTARGSQSHLWGCQRKYNLGGGQDPDLLSPPTSLITLQPAPAGLLDVGAERQRVLCCKKRCKSDKLD